jgi:hypothetical protein
VAFAGFGDDGRTGGEGKTIDTVLDEKLGMNYQDPGADLQTQRDVKNARQVDWHYRRIILRRGER